MRVTQRFTHDTLRNLPLSFKDITSSPAALHEQSHESSVGEESNYTARGTSWNGGPKPFEGTTAFAKLKYGKMLAHGQSFLPVPFTAKFASKVTCVEVSPLWFKLKGGDYRPI
jgi:hypothetical protein